jgi:myo-inositol-1(or 4)-monophosphatase
LSSLWYNFELFIKNPIKIMHPLLNIAISAARQASEIINRHADVIDHLQLTAKPGEGYFTEVDIKAEQAIIHTILKAYPDHGILAEESGVRNAEAETVWIIDPLDGTTNYLHGYPFYSISIAVKVREKIEHAVVYDPIRHECFNASRGCGARLNERRIRVSKQTQLSEALLGAGFPLRRPTLAEKYLPTWQSMFGKCGSIRKSGSVALDMAYVACGRLDGFWQLDTKPWDVAAATLLIREAGGLVSDMAGNEDILKQSTLVAGTPKVFKALLQTIGSVAVK